MGPPPCCLCGGQTCACTEHMSQRNTSCRGIYTWATLFQLESDELDELDVVLPSPTSLAINARLCTNPVVWASCLPVVKFPDSVQVAWWTRASHAWFVLAHASSLLARETRPDNRAYRVIQKVLLVTGDDAGGSGQCWLVLATESLWCWCGGCWCWSCG